MRKFMKLLWTFIPVFAFLLNTIAFASESDYPELLVTPRASERLKTEAGDEAGRRWTTHIPLQVSGTVTLIAGLMNPSSYGKMAGFAVGGGTIATTVLMSLFYKPYTSGLADVSTMPSGSARERLAKERAAESVINGASSLGLKLTILSVVANVGAAGYMLTQAPELVQKGAAGLAAVAAFAPVLFQYRWRTVACEQSDYKKKIYGPLSKMATTPVLHVAQNKTTSLGVGLALTLPF